MKTQSELQNVIVECLKDNSVESSIKWSEAKRELESLVEMKNLLSIKTLLVESSNYLQYIDVMDNFCEVQFDLITKKWYSFKTVGSSNSPEEIFINWIN